MNPFENEPFFLPVELMVVLAINVVVALLGYCVITMWGMFTG